MGPDPTVLLPIPAAPARVGLAPLAEGHPRIETGPCSCHDDPAGLERAA